MPVCGIEAVAFPEILHTLNHFCKQVSQGNNKTHKSHRFMRSNFICRANSCFSALVWRVLSQVNNLIWSQAPAVCPDRKPKQFFHRTTHATLEPCALRLYSFIYKYGGDWGSKKNCLKRENINTNTVDRDKCPKYICAYFKNTRASDS